MPVLFPFHCEWDESFNETRSYLTDIIIARNLAEQRRMLRSIARRTYTFTVITGSEQETALLESLVYRGLEDQMAIPYWPHATPLAVATAPGVAALQCETALRDFWAGGYAILALGPLQTELVQINTVGAGVLNLVGVTTKAWPLGTTVAPAHLGHIMADISMTRASTKALTVSEIVAEIDDPEIPATTAAFDDTVQNMLVTGMPDMESEISESWTRESWAINSIAGFRKLIAKRGQPVLSWDYPVKIFNLTDADELFGWYDSVVGKWRPSWVPDFQQSFQLDSNIGSADTNISIKWCGFTTYQFPHVPRRWLALVTAPGTVIIRRITNSVEAGALETLTINSAFGVTVDKATSLLCRARYSRMASDILEMEWVAPGMGICTIPLLDLPSETPAS